MRVEDYFPQGKRWWLRLHEKGGKHHEMPVHHTLEAYLDAYVQAAGISEEKKGWLFRAALARNGRLSQSPMLCRSNFSRRSARSSSTQPARSLWRGSVLAALLLQQIRVEIW